MLFPSPLVSGTLLQRYKRFLADVRLDSGEIITATCPNTGSMLGLTRRALAYGCPLPTARPANTGTHGRWWKSISAAARASSASTRHPNKLVAEAIGQGRSRPLAGYRSLRREVKYGRNSRIDILLEDPRRGACYVEIKNVHMMRKHGLAEFPDCVTERGVKHLAEMTDMVRQGHRAVMVYLVQRADASALPFRPTWTRPMPPRSRPHRGRRRGHRPEMPAFVRADRRRPGNTDRRPQRHAQQQRNSRRLYRISGGEPKLVRMPFLTCSSMASARRSARQP